MAGPAAPQVSGPPGPPPDRGPPAGGGGAATAPFFGAAETPARRPSVLRTMRMAAGRPGGFTPTVVPHRRIPVRQVLHGIRHDFRLSAWERWGWGRRLPHAGRVRLLGHDARRPPSGAATHRGSRPFPIPLIPAVCVQACRTTHMLPPFLHGVKSCFGGLITTAGRSGAESRILDRDAMDRCCAVCGGDGGVGVGCVMPGVRITPVSGTDHLVLVPVRGDSACRSLQCPVQPLAHAREIFFFFLDPGSRVAR